MLLVYYLVVTHPVTCNITQPSRRTIVERLMVVLTRGAGVEHKHGTLLRVWISLAGKRVLELQKLFIASS